MRRVKADTHRMQCMEIWGGNMLARESISLAGLDAWVEAHPHADDDAGGDVHYLSSCATGRITRLLLADVSGHGNAVATIARTLRTLMREHVNHLEQTRFVTRMNEAFTREGRAGIFATAIVFTYFAPTGELALCNAGHPPPLIYRAAERRWAFLDDDNASAAPPGSNLPLGILDLASYEQFRVVLKPGDRVLAYTDALVEARDASGELLGADGLLKIVEEVSGMSSGDFLDRLVAAVRMRATIDDDLTLLLMTPNATTRHVPFLKRAYAPIRVVTHWLRWRSDGSKRLPLPDWNFANLAGGVFEPLSRWRRR